jgi:hypothetical protein
VKSWIAEFLQAPASDIKFALLPIVTPVIINAYTPVNTFYIVTYLGYSRNKIAPT